MDTLNWARIYNALFSLINDQMSGTYYSGPDFLKAVRFVDPYYPEYSQLIVERQSRRESTSRRDYFWDILMSFNEEDRKRILQEILASPIKGKPKAALDKILTGKLEKFYEETCLLDQPFVKDPEMSVAKYLQEKSKSLGEEISVKSFVRIRIGEE